MNIKISAPPPLIIEFAMVLRVHNLFGIYIKQEIDVFIRVIVKIFYQWKDGMFYYGVFHLSPHDIGSPISDCTCCHHNMYNILKGWQLPNGF